MVYSHSGKGGLEPTSEFLKSKFPESDLPEAPLNEVLLKLALFTLGMVLLPISSYYLSLNYYFGEKNHTPAAITAAVVANAVLFSYVWVAMREDYPEDRIKAQEKKEE